MTDLAESRAILDRGLEEYRHARRMAKEERAELERLRHEYKDALQAQKIIQDTAQAVQAEAHKSMQAVVTRCLKTVFGPDGYDFKIKFNRKRGKTEAEIVFVQNGNELDPLSEGSGGACDLAAFALRVACLLLETPHRRRLMVMDEPFKNIHGEVYRERTATLIQKLSDELSIQFVLTTGFDWLKIGNVIQL
jgi:DNA repair exonuclease SbcCD ATPase subunit